MPTFPQDAKGLLISAIKDNNPVIYLEHRWLHSIKGDVPEGYYEVPIGEASVVKTGEDVTVIATSYMVLEALDAAKKLETQNISVEVIDLRSINPIDSATIIKSVKKTGRAVIADLGWKTYGAGAEISSLITENCWEELKGVPQRLGLPDHPTPSSPALAMHYYYGAEEIIKEIIEMMGINIDQSIYARQDNEHVDIPNLDFTGPF
jgi:pyruvate dehydrogenase E1 component beta subunit